MNAASTRAAAAGLAALLVSACSYFSTEPDPQIIQRVHEAVPRGTLMDSAESNLISLGFSCTSRTGEYEDESGQTRTAPHFLLCDERPGSFSFSCENRNRVVVIPTSADQVASVDVSRGPNCSRP